MLFNKKIFLSNINVFFSKSGKKPVDLEVAANVSRGYISRLSKSDNLSVPGIDFLLTASKMFDVSVEALSTIDFASLTETDEYYLNFIEKLIQNTEKRCLKWVKLTLEETKEKIENNIETNSIFSKTSGFVEVMQKLAQGNSEYKSSYDYGDYRYIGIKGDFYYIQLNETDNLYIVKVALENAEIEEEQIDGIELFMINEKKERKDICYIDPIVNHSYDNSLNKLYNSIVEAVNTKVLDEKTKNVLDAFINEKLL